MKNNLDKILQDSIRNKNYSLNIKNNSRTLGRISITYNKKINDYLLYTYAFPPLGEPYIDNGNVVLYNFPENIIDKIKISTIFIPNNGDYGLIPDINTVYTFWYIQENIIRDSKIEILNGTKTYTIYFESGGFDSENYKQININTYLIIDDRRKSWIQK